jgi:hypothetical protein
MLSIKEGFFRKLRKAVPAERGIKALRAEYRRERRAAQAAATREGHPQDADMSEEDAHEDEDAGAEEADAPEEPGAGDPGAGDPGAGDPGAGPSAPRRRTTFFPWRADSCNEAGRSGDPGKMARCDPAFEPDMPNVLTQKSQKEYEQARRYVVAFVCRARDKDGALEQFAQCVERSMTELCRNSTYDIMNISHIMGALKDLSARNFCEDGFSAAASVLAFEPRAGEQILGGERTFYVLVLKHYLDMLENGELCMRSVFKKMRSGVTSPGPRLYSEPFRCPGSRHVILPQFPEAAEVPLHSEGCRAVPRRDSPPEARERWERYVTAVRESYAAQGASSDVLCACADPRALREIGCTCFRSVPCTMIRGSRTAPTLRLSAEMSVRAQPRAAAELEFVQLLRPMDDLAFEEHMRKTLRWPEERLHAPGGRGLYSEEARRFHPSLSAAAGVDKSPVPGLDVPLPEGGTHRSYPRTYVQKYLEGLKDMLDRSCALINAATRPESEEASTLRQVRGAGGGDRSKEEDAEQGALGFCALGAGGAWICAKSKFLLGCLYVCYNLTPGSTRWPSCKLRTPPPP